MMQLRQPDCCSSTGRGRGREPEQQDLLESRVLVLVQVQDLAPRAPLTAYGQSSSRIILNATQELRQGRGQGWVVTGVEN